MSKQKLDLDRLGYFNEPSYISIGDPYLDPARRLGIQEQFKGRQLFGITSRSRCGLNHGYFSDYQRTFVGEGLVNMGKIHYREKLEENKKNIQPQFLPASGYKLPNGSGTLYGTFTKPSPYFCGAEAKSARVEERPNIVTNPPKKGTGFGYPNVTINKFPIYESSPYVTGNTYKEENDRHKQLLGGRREFLTSNHSDYFEPNPFKQDVRSRSLPNISKSTLNNVPVFRPPNPGKLSGGCYAGTLNPFPTHQPNPYIDTYQINKQPKEKRIFMPSSGSKTTRTESIMLANIRKYITPTSYSKMTTNLQFGCEV
ncbi:hypothetical protein AHF37_04367 [Paragonimus kellicotti]|nr:hypothetical protein AHF37_04367 [Paragonimus kellicotti]